MSNPYPQYPGQHWGPPNQPPPPPPAPKRKKWPFVVGGGLLLLIIIGLSSGGGSEPASPQSGATAGATAGAAVTAAEDAPFVPAFPGATEEDVVVQAGESVTVDEVTMSSTPLKPVKPQFGSPQLCTDVTYANGSSDPASFFGGIDWKLQDPNGVILMNGYSHSDNRLDSGEIAPGGKVSGQVCFDAPQGSPTGLYVVLLDPSFRFSSDRVAWLNAR